MGKKAAKAKAALCPLSRNTVDENKLNGNEQSKTCGLGYKPF
jgi:hypothetical protein